jgi:hypothetical protein
VVTAPLTPSHAKVTTVAVEWTVRIICVVFSMLIAVTVRTGLDRFRARSWDRALRLLPHNDDGWANRHS